MKSVIISELGGPISLPGWAFVVFVTVIVPSAVLRNRDSAVLMASIPMASRFLAMLTPQLFLGGLALWTGFLEGVELFPSRAPQPAGWLAGLVFILLALALVRPHWRRSVEEERPTWRLFAPTNRRERWMWVILSFSAGTSEELVWRGVLPALLTTVSLSPILAIALSVISFALAHAIQGFRSVLAIAALAAAFHALVFISGSLYVGMAVHFIYDVIAGFTYARFARDLGRLAPEPPEV